jgi:hypothetical protein
LEPGVAQVVPEEQHNNDRIEISCRIIEEDEWMFEVSASRGGNNYVLLPLMKEFLA